MSTLRVNNITDTTGGSNLNVPGTAKAWVNFNGTGTTGQNQTIRASLNVSSVLKNGTGDYTVNFTNALADANYSLTGTASGNNAQSFTFTHAAATTAPTTSACRVFCSASGSGFDSTYVSVAIFR